jgi:hypothetical protein
VVVLDDGVTRIVPSFDQPTCFPHELAHHVVERALGLTHGFWGGVDAGVVFSGMKVLQGGHPPCYRTLPRELARANG